MAGRPDDALSFVRRHQEKIALFGLLFMAFALRVYQVNWDDGHLYHPDERYILMTTGNLSLSWPLNIGQLLTPKSTLDPQGFAYGTLPFYLLRLVDAILVWINHLAPFLHFLDRFNDLGNLRLIGRPISALFDTASVYLIYRLGRQLFGSRAAWLGGLFVCFSAIDIQFSHFYATDTLLTAFVLAAVVASVEYARAGQRSSAVWAGIFAGLALATKASAAPVFAPVVLAHLVRQCVSEDDGRVVLHWPDIDSVVTAIPPAIGTLLVAAMTFIIVEPYAIIDFHSFVSGLREQSDMVRGIADLPYTRQYFGRPPYLYFLQNLLLFGVGVPLGASMVVGFLNIVWRTFKRPGPGKVLLLSYVIPYFVITGNFYAKFMRYLLPITPLLALFGAYSLIQLIDLARSWRRDKSLEEKAFPPSPESAAPRFGSSGSPPLQPILATASASTLDATSSQNVPELDPETLQFAQLKGLSLDWLAAGAYSGCDTGDERTLEIDPVEIDPDSLRFAQIKGLSLDWFIGQDDPEAAPTGAERARVVWTELEDDNGARPGSSSFFDRWSAIQRLARGQVPYYLAYACLAIVLLATAFYGLALDNMYSSTTTPVEGSQWLYRYAPRGSVIATEHWEEGMPMPLVGNGRNDTAQSHNFKIVTMPMYDDDNAQKLTTVVNNLRAADYVVFFSNRLYGTIPRIPSRYPMSRRYYVDLFGEKLGFKLVAAFDRYPNLFGIAFVDDTTHDPGLPTPPLLREQHVAPVTINLGHADESFSVYDHQKVLIFKKTQQLTTDQLRALIGPPPAPNEISTANHPTNYKSLLLTPAQEAIVNPGGTFRDIFDRTNFLNQVPLLVWLCLIVLVGLAGVPFGFPVLRFLPDRGYLISKTLGVLVLVWFIWIVVSLGIVQATRPVTLILFAIFLEVAAVLGHLQRDRIIAFIRARWRLLLIEEAVFWLAFFYDVLIRSINPDLWHPTLGGEKPMDLAYYIASARTPIFPPYDPWFAGGYLNYYYFGQVIAGTLTKISGVLPTTSYNIVVPLLFALTVAGAFSAAVSLLHRGAGIPTRSTIVGGVLSALMVCLIGNLAGFGQLAHELTSISTVPPTSLPIVGPAISMLVGGAEVILHARTLSIPPDWFWGPTRVINGTINEFPYFTFLFADLHAHLIGLPFTLLAIGLGVNLVKSGGQVSGASEPGSADVDPAGESVAPSQTGGWLGYLRQRLRQTDWSDVALVMVIGLTVGALFPINSWDYPTYLGIVAVCTFIPWYLAYNRTRRDLMAPAIRLVAIVVLSRVLFQPFYGSFQSFYSGVHTIPDKSDVGSYFAIHGMFIAVMVSFFLIEGWTLYGRLAIARSMRLYVKEWELLPRAVRLQRALVRRWDRRELAILYGIGAVALIAAACFALNMALTGILIVLFAMALVIAFDRRRSVEDCFVVLLFATGLALSIGTEQVAIDGDVGRMNTVFKFYEQVWVLWGIASAVTVVRYLPRLRALKNRFIRRTWLAALAILMAMTLVYPILGTTSRLSDRFNTAIAPTLDGTAYMDSATYVDDGKPLRLQSDKEMIHWLWDNVKGTPFILEGTRPLYRWGSRISIYTGLPTVIGWDWHQKQQRMGFSFMVDQRMQDVQTMYSNPSIDQTLALLHKYHVTYIIDGELEQAFYPPARTKFDEMVGSSLMVVYDRDGGRIYQVLR